MGSLIAKPTISTFLFCTFLCLLTVTPKAHGQAYTYDDLGRLTTVRFSGTETTVIRYTYDPAGNLTSRTTTSATEAKEHTLESDHPSFEIREDGKRYKISLEKDETAEVSVRLITEDGSANVDETIVTAVVRGNKVDINSDSKSTSDGSAAFNITGAKAIRAVVIFTTKAGEIKLVVRRNFNDNR